LQELDETLYWLDLLPEASCVEIHRLTELKSEAEELISILVTSVKTLKKRRTS